MSKSTIALIAAIIVFVTWMSMMGNPHVVESVIGLILACGTFFVTWNWLRKRGS
ncbi:MAG: hypothetical protein OXH52_21595 [Gammaproteobacteria bacterium]|nr:hypothetical protein [Gammaproteobacteria bacterium]